MDLTWGSEGSKKFVTNVGLITSDGPNGPNVMSAEWTHHISYQPPLIAVCIHPIDATAENIKASKEFGVNLAAIEQATLTSVAGGNTGKKVDKIKALEELGYRFYKAKKIKVLMIEGAALNAECKVIKMIELGDHTMFVGEVVEGAVNPDKEAIVFHDGRYLKAGENIGEPTTEELEKIKNTVDKHKK